MTAAYSPDTQTVPQRLDHIQALRGIAALLVMISHLLIVERKYSPDQILGDWAIYGMVGVDLFFVISGFIMVYVMWERPRGIKASGEFLYSRAARIYPLYWIISAVLLALWFVRPDMVFSSIQTSPDIFKSFALWPQDREPLLAVGWTLVHEMYFYLVFAGIMLLPRKALLPCLAIWFALISAFHIYYIRGLPELNAATSLITSKMTYQFMVGALLAWDFKRGGGVTPSGKFEKTAALILLVLGIIWMASELTALREFPNNSGRGAALAGPCGLIVLGLACRDLAGQRIWSPFVRLGDWSYSLYLTHVLSLTVLGRIWAQFSTEGLIDNAIILAVMVLATLIVSGLVYRYIEAPIIKAARNTRRRLFISSPN